MDIRSPAGSSLASLRAPIAASRPAARPSPGWTQAALPSMALAMMLPLATAALAAGSDAGPATSITPAAAPAITTRFPVLIRPAAPAPRVQTGRTNHLGEAATVACSTCHTTTRPNRDTHQSSELDEFHQGLRFAHGQLACLSCHNAQDYDTLHLATGKPVAFQDVMTLCGQCHGTALRDYDRGSHGGMTGYWDLSKGPRTRNNCTHCHDPHSPRYPQARPVFAPQAPGAYPHRPTTPSTALQAPAPASRANSNANAIANPGAATIHPPGPAATPASAPRP